MLHRRRMIRLGLLAGLAVLSGGALFVVATHHPNDYTFFPKCQLHSLTGLHCPGCGLTRSVHALLNGNVPQALAYNVLSPIVLPLIAVSVIRSLWSWAWGAAHTRPQRERRWRQPRWFPFLIMALLIAFGIARNIPTYPFTLLAPHELGSVGPAVPDGVGESGTAGPTVP